MSEALPLIWRKFPERYTLAGNSCSTCGEDFFPARGVCPNCRRRGKLSAKQMPRKGKVISYTEVMTGPTGFDHETPYFLAIIELENGARLLSQVVDSENEKVRIGAHVEKVFRKISEQRKEGAIAYGYKFRVVK
ncbi:MAG: Zn-ribbon domain-containing OB-fold protein [Candidatus Diapherotrites archaeon]